jgi:hypothetical protein
MKYDPRKAIEEDKNRRHYLLDDASKMSNLSEQDIQNSENNQLTSLGTINLSSLIQKEKKRKAMKK